MSKQTELAQVADTITVDSGNVGIGTSSPASLMHLESDTPVITLRDTSAYSAGTGPYVQFQGLDSGSTNRVFGQIYGLSNGSNSGELAFYTRNSGSTAERMRITSAGQLLIGRTATSGVSDGHRFDANGFTQHVRDGGSVLELSRETSDGDIQVFKKGTTTVGSIGVNNTDNLFISGNSTHAGLEFLGVSIAPHKNGSLVDNTLDIGTGSNRFDDIYATNGTIQTSDRNEKQDIEALSNAEQRVAVAAKGLMRKFRWRDAVEAKGDEARTHFGIIAQDLQAAFAAEGLDAGDYAMFISSTWTDEETGEERTRMGVRYSELLAFIIAAI